MAETLRGLHDNFVVDDARIALSDHINHVSRVSGNNSVVDEHRPAPCTFKMRLNRGRNGSIAFLTMVRRSCVEEISMEADPEASGYSRTANSPTHPRMTIHRRALTWAQEVEGLHQWRRAPLGRRHRPNGHPVLHRHQFLQPLLLLF